MPRTPSKAPTTSDPLRRDVASEDGIVRFSFQRTADGMKLARDERHADGSRVSYTVLFDSHAEFKRFIDADALRFAYPLTYHRLEQAWHDVFASRA